MMCNEVDENEVELLNGEGWSEGERGGGGV